MSTEVMLHPLCEGDKVLIQEIYAPDDKRNEFPCGWWRGTIIRNNGNKTYGVRYSYGKTNMEYPENKIRSHHLFHMSENQSKRLARIDLEFICNKPEDRNININKEDIIHMFIQDPSKRHFAIEYFTLERDINNNDLHEILVKNDKFYSMVCDFIHRRTAVRKYKMQQWEKDVKHRAHQMKYVEKQILSSQQTKLATVISRYGDVNNTYYEDVITDVLLEMPQYLRA